LKKENIPFESICAVFVTHDHADHIKSLGVVASKAMIPIYATKKIHEGITRNYCITTPIDPQYTRFIEKESSIEFKDMKIKGEVALVIAGSNPKFARSCTQA
jgi:phosphoribosyl 1,2-cyclic phosphodiesterase